MARAISSVIGLIALLAMLIWGAFYVSIRAVHSWPEETTVTGLTAPVQIAWTEDEVPRIYAHSAEDEFAALGYVHGLTRTWSIALWRQTARGQLGQWFDGRADRLDEWAHQLGWARRAREAYRQLTEQERSWLQAYARGVNAAFQARGHRASELLLLQIHLEPWRPWHTLAVEQLIAWLGAGRLVGPPGASDNSQINTWLTAERQLHEWTQLHSFDHSAAWAVEGSSGVSLAQRQVYGSSALPLLEEAVLERDDAAARIVSVPGTIMMPGGRTASHAWAVFLTSEARLDSIGGNVVATDVRRERIQRGDGSEHLTVVQQSSDGLHLSDRWRLQWTGFDVGTDFPAWHSLRVSGDNQASFRLFNGNGLLITRKGESRVLGNPRVVRRFSEGIAVGQDQWIDRLTSAMQKSEFVTADKRPDRRAASRAVYSPWADTLRARMISMLSSSETWPAQHQQALTYLRNWEGTFDAASIGASIFDTWVAVYADSTGDLPHLGDVQTSHERILLYNTFQRAVNLLVERYGTDLSRWRWELVQPNEQYFPIWSIPDLLPDDVDDMTNSKFAPIEPSGGGHPSALQWGASTLEQGERAASAAWEASVSTSAWQRMYVRKSDVPVDGFLERYLVTHQYPRTFVIDSAGTEVRRITLQPPREE